MKKTLLALLILSTLSLCAAAVPAPKITFKQDIPTFIAAPGIALAADETAVSRWMTREFLPTYLPGTMARPTLARHIAHDGIHVFRYDYTVNGVPVDGAATTVAIRDGKVYRITNAMGKIAIDTTPRISAAQAARTALTALTGTATTNTPKHSSELRVIRHRGNWQLAWKVRLAPTSIIDGRFHYVDARTGALLSGGTDTRSAEPTDMAKVFETNPLRNPSPIEVELPWIDPADGKLTAVADAEGVRAIVATNCPDEGKTTVVQGYGEIPVCTPTQMADKNKNGSFIYEDWQNGLDLKFDAQDIYPEVSMYYHASKIYKFLRELEIDGFHYLSGHKAGTENPNPLIVVANFQYPSQSGGLGPMDNAFFSPNQPGFNDIFFADFPYQGDLMVFGQGSKTDFAYDGDVVYHEFGHAVEATTSQLSPMPFADQYGFSNVPIGINEGIADSFSFIMSQDACLGEYASEGLAGMAGYQKGEDGFYCMRRADNANLINEDFTGESHHDGLPFVGTNWALYQAGIAKGLTRDDFARLFIRMLMSFTDAQATPQDYAAIMLSEVENDPKFAPLKTAVETLLEERGFNEPIRARDITQKVDYIFSGGTDAAYGAPETSFMADVQGTETKIAPAYVQFYIDMPECMDTLTVTGTGYANSQTGSGSNPYYYLYARKDKPIHYDLNNYPVPVDVDTVLEPKNNEYLLKKLEPGARYYLQFVNLAGEGLVVYIAATPSRTSTEDCIAASDDDSITADDSIATDDELTADEIADTDTVTKKSDGGCALVTL
ncbi:MAG TPA: hypothetical protein PLV42_00425 [bacterium]|nr:hypothetical protein [bacterium]